MSFEDFFGLGLVVEPIRGVDILHRAAEAPDSWLEDREDESDMDDAYRQRLFDEWFSGAYEAAR